ncbi:DUF4352 domain-containing protein [Spirochaeta cellobiosiphila]|uniref:DUF4352 domain-containing protein n=1 Tax=Spirochaeta cellobiosiphila TaxID=504483 RepID=UPI0003FD97B1|nr:DUF4352 domain-containing protein [Spirochaeta cellobiosiphila]
MKKNLLLATILIQLLFSCATTSNLVSPENKTLIVDQIVVTINNAKGGLRSIKIGYMKYTPKEKDNLFLDISLSIKNESEEAFHLNNLNKIELITFNNNEFEYHELGKSPKEQNNVQSQVSLWVNPNILPNGLFEKNYLFTYHEDSIPVAILYNRKDYLLLKNGNTYLDELNIELEKQQKFSYLLDNFPNLNDEEIIQYMTENNINFFDITTSPENVYIKSILNKKNIVFDEAVKEGGKIDEKLFFEFYQIRPIHLALMSGNDHAVSALINIGIEIDSDRNSDYMKFLLDLQSVESLILLDKYGIDISTYKMRNGMQKSFTIREYAKLNNLTKIIDYLDINNY